MNEAKFKTLSINYEDIQYHYLEELVTTLKILPLSFSQFPLVEEVYFSVQVQFLPQQTELAVLQNPK